MTRTYRLDKDILNATRARLNYVVMHAHPQELGEAVVCAIVRLKQAHPHWGPRKIQALYARHGMNSDTLLRAVYYKYGVNQVVRREYVFAHQIARKTVTAQATWPTGRVCSKGCHGVDAACLPIKK